MKRVQVFLSQTLGPIIAHLSAQIGKEVRLDETVLDRSDSLNLAPPGCISPNGACRLIKTRDAWLAFNLPRAEDLDDIPVLLSILFASLGKGEHDPESFKPNVWDALERNAPNFPSDVLLEQALLFGLAVAKVGETPPPAHPCAASHITTRVESRRKLRVIDFSNLWAGPLCASVFAALGAEVVKLEAVGRPDTTAKSQPLLDKRLNGAKQRLQIELASSSDRANFPAHIGDADILVTNMPARSAANFSLVPETLLKEKPNLIWIAITGHGWNQNRIAFGDDAAASGGLVERKDEAPHFIGDAIADPLTGLAAAAAALELIADNKAGFIDASLAHTAAFAAHGAEH